MKERVIQRVLAMVLAVVVAAGLGLGLSFIGGRFVQSPEERLLSGVELLPDNAVDVSEFTTGLKGDTVLFEIEGQAVTAQEYLYWLGNVTNYYEMMYAYSGVALDLSQEAMPGVTWAEQLKEEAYQNAALLALTTPKAKEYGVKLDAGDIAQVVEAHKNKVTKAGGEASYAYQLQAMGIDDSVAFQLDMDMALFVKVQQAVIEKAKRDLSAEDVAQYVEENDLLRAKHILLLTMDMSTREPYDEATQAQQRAKAEALLAQLRADPGKFDKLMNENSEDSGLAANPDGYLFTSGQMVGEFEEGTRALEYGEISELVQSAYGYHIILRLDPDCDEVRQAAAAVSFNDTVEGWVEAAKVDRAPEYDAISTADYYEKLMEFQAGLAQPDIQDQSNAQLQGVTP